MAYTQKVYRVDGASVTGLSSSIKASVQIGASPAGNLLPFSLSTADVLSKFDSAPGTPDERHVFVRNWIAEQIVAQIGELFRPRSGSPLVQSADFDQSTGRLELILVVGGSLLVEEY